MILLPILLYLQYNWTLVLCFVLYEFYHCSTRILPKYYKCVDPKELHKIHEWHRVKWNLNIFLYLFIYSYVFVYLSNSYAIIVEL
jgi:hypothetical protein